MSFTSLAFAVFLPLVFVVYWAIGSGRRRFQNVLLLVASAVFYGWWDARFLALIALSIVVDYAVGRGMSSTPSQRVRKLLLYVSLAVNLGVLGFFKYYGFFVDSFRAAFSLTAEGPGALDILLPVGISFYTFQTLSYSIDVYRGKLQASDSLLDFATFVSFFPQLVAGPIERATQLLPQFAQRRAFDDAAARTGLRQILWGLFTKMVVADNCAVVANAAFGAAPGGISGFGLVLGMLAFTVQIYADFAGYSNIAIGTARLFGITLSQNFATPYFSRNVAEFWRRWHISLSTWFRDYVYVPLGGSRGTRVRTVINVAIVFVVSGLWHGAAWTFVAWGALHAAYMAPLVWWGGNRRYLGVVAEGSQLPRPTEALHIAGTFVLVALAWVLFRAESVVSAWHYWLGLFQVEATRVLPTNRSAVLLAGGWAVVLLAVEWYGRDDAFGIAGLARQPSVVLRWTCYLLLVCAIGLYMRTDAAPFIYFQF